MKNNTELSKNYDKLRQSLIQLTGRSEVSSLSAKDLAAMLEDEFISNEARRADWFKLFSVFLPDVCALDAAYGTNTFESVFAQIGKKLAIPSPDSQAFAQGWQKNRTHPEVQAMLEFVKAQGVWCLKHDIETLAAQALFDMLPFDGEELLLTGLSGRSISLKSALDAQVSHQKLVDWLLDSEGEWKRWPEFLYERARDKRISREMMAWDMGLHGMFKKQRVVRLLKREVARQKKQKQGSVK